MDFAQGFEVWRALGMLQDGSHISFAGLTAIHYVHRLAAYVVLAALVAVAWRLARHGALRAQARWLAALAVLQLATGLSNVVLDWPLIAAVLHTGGAAALVVVLTWAVVSSRAAARPYEISAPQGAPRVSA
jgi:cytochrome c oxidase assembly protein subunit 15